MDGTVDGTVNGKSAAATREALLHCPSITLRNGMDHPCIGYGTYKVGYLPPSASEATAAVAAAVTASTTSSKDKGATERTAVDCVADAIEVGYRFFECAQFYGNEAAVGRAIQQSIQAGTVTREDFFLCSKVWTTTIEQGALAIRDQLDQTLKDLQTDYLDLYLIHWPVPCHHVTAYRTLLELRDAGKIRGIGVSNYSYEDWQELKQQLPDTADWPLVNQIEVNPFLYRQNTIAKFAADGIVVQSYRSLRDGKAMTDPVLAEIAASYSKSAAQVLGRWCVQHGVVYTPKSVQTARMLENANVFDFELSASDMKRLDGLTTDDALQTFQALYRKCVNRDTTKDGTMDGVKMNITLD